MSSLIAGLIIVGAQLFTRDQVLGCDTTVDHASPLEEGSAALGSATAVAELGSMVLAEGGNGHAVKKSDSLCALSATDLRRTDLLIDQRPRAQHEAWPIPGAIYGVPSDAGTMRIFAPKRVVLVGTGRDDVTLIRRCSEHRASGVEHVFVLVGGVRTLVEAQGIDAPKGVRDRLYLLSSTELSRLAQDDAIVVAAGLDEDEIRIWRELLELPLRPEPEMLEHTAADSADASRSRVILLADGDTPVEWMETRHMQPDARTYFYNQSPDTFRRHLALAETLASNAYKPLPSGACGR